jgi:hypothetical protein
VSEDCLSACEAIGVLNIVCEPPRVDVLGLDRPWVELADALEVLLSEVSARVLSNDAVSALIQRVSEANKTPVGCDEDEKARLEELEQSAVRAISTLATARDALVSNYDPGAVN